MKHLRALQDVIMFAKCPYTGAYNCVSRQQHFINSASLFMLGPGTLDKIVYYIVVSVDSTISSQLIVDLYAATEAY